MKDILGLMLGIVLSSSVIGCIYRLGYVRGEIAAMESEVAR